MTSPYNVVIVSSKIIVSQTPLSYSQTRSQYTSGDRFRDLLLTFQSIKRHVPNPYIIVIDNSVLPPIWKHKLQTVSNDFLNPTRDRFLRFQTDISPYKGLGECCQLVLALKHLQTLTITFERVFKITGRYVLNNSFRMVPFLGRHNIFKRSEFIHDRPYYHTCFFKIDKAHLDKFYQCLIDVTKVYRARDFARFGGRDDLEVLLPATMGNNFELVRHLGVTQRVAIALGSHRDEQRI